MKMKDQIRFRDSILKILALSILMAVAISLLSPSRAHAAVSQGTIKLKLLETTQLTVPVADAPRITWTSTDESVCVTLDTPGKIQAVGAGTCNINAKVLGGKVYQWKIKVKKSTLKINKTSLTLIKRRGKRRLKLSGTEKKNAVWSSSNPSVASVSSSGYVTPHKKGVALIQATAGSLSVSCSVQVLSSSPTNLKKFYSTSTYKNRVVLVGSTLFDHWTNFSSDFGSTKVINNSYAHASIAAWTTNYKKLITNYKPKAVVICLGTEEIHGNKIEPEKCAKNMQKLISKIHKKAKSAKIFFVSIPYYPGRSEALWKRVKTYNSLMKTYCKKHKKYCKYLDLASALLKNKKPNASMFSGTDAHSNLYLTSKGYRVVKKVIVQKVRKAI